MRKKHHLINPRCLQVLTGDSFGLWVILSSTVGRVASTQALMTHEILGGSLVQAMKLSMVGVSFAALHSRDAVPR